MKLTTISPYIQQQKMKLEDCVHSLILDVLALMSSILVRSTRAFLVVRSYGFVPDIQRRPSTVAFS